MRNKKLYVGNLPFSAEENQLRSLFGADGRQVASVRILVDRQTGRSRGFGFIEMASPEDAQKAMDALHGHEFLGRPLMISEARDEAAKDSESYGNRRSHFGHRGGGFRSNRGPGPR